MKIRLHSDAAGKSSDTVGLQGGKEGPVHYYTPCGWRHNYYQVSLDVIADGIMSVEEFADAFIAGGGQEPDVTQEWLDEWNEIKRVVKKKAPGIKGFSRDASRISSLIGEGKYVVHHSEAYNQAYKPHYRIMRRDIFEHYQKLSFSFFDRNNTGEMMSRIVSDLFDITEFIFCFT